MNLENVSNSRCLSLVSFAVIMTMIKSNLGEERTLFQLTVVISPKEVRAGTKQKL